MRWLDVEYDISIECVDENCVLMTITTFTSHIQRRGNNRRGKRGSKTKLQWKHTHRYVDQNDSECNVQLNTQIRVPVCVERELYRTQDACLTKSKEARDKQAIEGVSYALKPEEKQHTRTQYYRHTLHHCSTNSIQHLQMYRVYALAYFILGHGEVGGTCRRSKH